MLPIAAQTARPIRLNFFVDTQGWPPLARKNSKFKKKYFFFHGHRRALQLVVNIIT